MGMECIQGLKDSRKSRYFSDLVALPTLWYFLEICQECSLQKLAGNSRMILRSSAVTDTEPAEKEKKPDINGRSIWLVIMAADWAPLQPQSGSKRWWGTSAELQGALAVVAQYPLAGN